MLDTRSGQLLTSQTFNKTFSQLQFAAGGVSYLFHQSASASEELMELHHLDLSTKSDRVITQITLLPHQKVRPIQWRGSFSPDGALLAYQKDVLTPSITVLDAMSGSPISEIRWKEDLTALPVFIDPRNELMVIPLARWDDKFTYKVERQLLVAHLKTGAILGQYESPGYISHVLFHDKVIVLHDTTNNTGHLTVGSPEITWKPIEAAQQHGRHHAVYSHAQTAGLFSRTNGRDDGEFQLLNHAGLEPGQLFTLEKGFMPMGLRGGMLVSEKQTPRELSTWMHKINERFSALCGRYLIAPLTHTVLYQDAANGKHLAEYRFEERNLTNYVTHRVSGSKKMATIYHEPDHLGVEFYDIFPFWTSGTIALLAAGLTLIFRFSKSGLHCLALLGSLGRSILARQAAPL